MLVEAILQSAQWAVAKDWGAPRPGHPEGTVGRHVSEQILPFIDRWYRGLPEYWDLVALAYLHDIGKPATTFTQGRLHGESHSVLSARIARAIGASERIVQVILSNDRAYSSWRRLHDKKRAWAPGRWNSGRKQRFLAEFGTPDLDLRLLVLFHRADNAYRRPAVLDESVDSVLWFENRLVDENLLTDVPPEGRNERLDWQGEAS